MGAKRNRCAHLASMHSNLGARCWLTRQRRARGITPAAGLAFCGQRRLGGAPDEQNWRRAHVVQRRQRGWKTYGEETSPAGRKTRAPPSWCTTTSRTSKSSSCIDNDYVEAIVEKRARVERVLRVQRLYSSRGMMLECHLYHPATFSPCTVLTPGELRPPFMTC